MLTISPYITLNTRSGAAPRLKRCKNATPESFGATFGALDNNSALATVKDLRGYVGAIKFNGTRAFLAVVGDHVYRTRDNGASWTGVFTLNGLHPGMQSAKAGIWAMHVDNVVTAVVVWSDGGVGKYYAATTQNGVDWKSFGPFSSGMGDCFNFTDVVEWQGKLVSFVHNTGAYVSAIFDPIAGTMTFALLRAEQGSGWRASGAICNLDDRLFALVQQYPTGKARLFELRKSAWTLALELEAGFTDPGNDEFKGGLFSDGANLLAFYLKGGEGWRCAQISAALAKTDTTELLPPVLRSSGTPNTGRIQIIVDARANPSAPSFWVLHANDGSSSSPWNLYTWPGGGQPMKFVEAGGEATQAMPFVKHTQGATFSTPGERYLELKGSAPAPDGILLKFTGYSDDGVDWISVRAFQGPSTAPYPVESAALVGKTIDFLADNETIHSVAWDARKNGFVSGQRAKFALECYPAGATP